MFWGRRSVCSETTTTSRFNGGAKRSNTDIRDEYDFSKGKRAKDVPHLAKLQAESKGKTRITIMLDNVNLYARFNEFARRQGRFLARLSADLP